MFVAIVGSRECSKAEAEAAYRLAHALALRGHTIISGLARGIDTAALSAAVKAKSTSVAVLPTAPSEGVYPASNAGLAHSIIDLGGLVLTPYTCKSKHLWQLRRRLIERNFLIALCADICFVVSDEAVISGGTGWTVWSCHALNKTVIRLDSKGALHLCVTHTPRRISWQPELEVLKQHIRPTWF